MVKSVFDDIIPGGNMSLVAGDEPIDGEGPGTGPAPAANWFVEKPDVTTSAPAGKIGNEEPVISDMPHTPEMR